MKKLLNGLEKIDNTLFAVQKVFILLGVVLMVVINGAQVFCRYVLHSSLAWSEQVSVLLFFYLIMLGANLGVKSDSETRIDVLQFKDAKKNVTLHLITDVISVVTVVVFFISSIALLEHAGSFPQYLSSIHLDYFYIYLGLPIGFGLIFFDKVINILKKLCVLTGSMTPEQIGMGRNEELEDGEEE